MTRYEVVKATPLHAHTMMWEGIRPEDESELWAAASKTPLQVLLQGLKESHEAWVGLADGVPFCMVGVAPRSILGSTGVPWMVGTVALDRHAKAFLRACRPVLQEMLGRYEHLENWVDARNSRAIRWLWWMGFDVGPTEPYGWMGLPFHHFEMRRAHV